jgi:hypothetical protein
MHTFVAVLMVSVLWLYPIGIEAGTPGTTGEQRPEQPGLITKESQAVARALEGRRRVRRAGRWRVERSDRGGAAAISGKTGHPYLRCGR